MLTNCINRIAKSFFLALLLLTLAVSPGTAQSQTNLPAPATATPLPSQATPPAESKSDQIEQRWILSFLIVLLLVIGAAYRVRKPQNAAAK